MDLFIRHLIYHVLAKKTIDKVLKLVRKLDWDNDGIRWTLHKVFTKPWKITYGNISLLAMLTYDLQRYRPTFAISVVDQVLEDIRRGMEQNIYNTNQRRVAVIKYLGELYIYRLLSSGIIFDTLWSLVTFGHRKLSHLFMAVWLIPYFSGWTTAAQTTDSSWHARWFFPHSACLCPPWYMRHVFRPRHTEKETRQLLNFFPGTPIHSIGTG